ncbi:MAG TPA: arylesterase [Burkholderiales bacterium]|nr:arylesterase [Burkholderiales bacterium]
MLKHLLFVLLGLWSTAATAGGNVLVYGDSLSAAYGISPKQGWVALLEERLREEKFDYRVVNASISGETTSGGAARIDTALKKNTPNVLVVALGANDGLRGLPVSEMRRNLGIIIKAAQHAKARVLLVGMRVPPNYGARYAREFEQSFADLAKEYRTAYVPFLLEGVIEQRTNFQEDNLHPVASAQPRMLDTVWPGLKPLLK